MKPLSFLCVGLALCWTTPSIAQKKPSLDGEKVIADFARCAVRAAPREAMTVLDTLPDSNNERAQIDLLLQKHFKCMDFGPSIQGQQLAAEVSLGRTTLAQAVTQLPNMHRQMTFPRRAIRGAVAERVYLDSVEKRPLISPVPTSIDDRDAGPIGYLVVRCAVARNPVSADRLVRAKRLSSAERDAARSLAPALNSCALGKGRVDISGNVIHGWAAEALYKQGRPDATEGR